MTPTTPMDQDAPADTPLDGQGDSPTRSPSPANDLVVIVESDGTIRFASVGWAELLGTPIAGLVGRRLQDLLEEPGVPLATLLRHHPTPGSLPAEVMVRGARGEVATVELSLVESIDQALGLATVIIARETAAGRAEREARLAAMDRLASVGVLAAGVVHDLNNMLVYLSVRLRHLRKELEPLTIGCRGVEPPALRTLADIRDGVDRLATMTHDLKGFSMEALPAHLLSVDLRQILTTALRFTRHELGARARVVEEYLDLPAVRGVEIELTQVFVNLLLNAAQAIAADRKDVGHEIRVRAATSAEGDAIVEIHDSGIGMPEQVVRALFTPFFTTRPRGIGTGLGLWMAHRIIERHGGLIVVESRVGSGTTFRVLLPARRDRPGAPEPDPE